MWWACIKQGEAGIYAGRYAVDRHLQGKGNVQECLILPELEQQRLELQNELAHLSTNGKHIIDKTAVIIFILKIRQQSFSAIEEVLHAYKTHTKLK